MSQRTASGSVNWIGLLGPAITVLALGGTMALGFGAQSQRITDIGDKVDKLYDVLIYPNIPRRGNP